ncbi:T6SS immunity protein Tdi1 domain-containing protein [Streptomyces sp. NPDC001852]|uniref:T6SS immunity protein Tdi1 domain-containing protein n=1 Tax=Streptomyces sp. NPDC001852 TaxID=3364619 RepID=UPI0036B750E8
MFDTFAVQWPETAREQLEPAQFELPLRGNATPAYQRLAEVFRHHAGTSFADGLYRIHGVETAQQARDYCLQLAPGAGRVTFPFAFDWLGRQLAVDLRDPQNLPVVQFDPAAGKAYESEMALVEFHDLISEESLAGEALSWELYREWRAQDMDPLGFDECVGLGVPLFLGGEEAVSNLQRSSLDVYWELSCQLARGVSGLQAARFPSP